MSNQSEHRTAIHEKRHQLRRWAIGVALFIVMFAYTIAIDQGWLRLLLIPQICIMAE
jgi:hypothetical protein